MGNLDIAGNLDVLAGSLGVAAGSLGVAAGSLGVAAGSLGVAASNLDVGRNLDLVHVHDFDVVGCPVLWDHRQCSGLHACQA